MYSPSGYLLDFIIDLIRLGMPVSTVGNIDVQLSSNEYPGVAKRLITPSTMAEVLIVNVYLHTKDSPQEQLIYINKTNTYERVPIFILNSYLDLVAAPQLYWGNHPWVIEGIVSRYVNMSSEVKKFKYIGEGRSTDIKKVALALKNIDLFSYGEYLSFLDYLKSMDCGSDRLNKYHSASLDNIANLMLKYNCQREDKMQV
jgi:hypothetical protein